MKKTKILIMALIMTMFASTTFAGGLGDLFGSGKDKEAEEKRLAGNLWYDEATDFSSVKKVLFYPAKINLDPDIWQKYDKSSKEVSAEAVKAYESIRAAASIYQPIYPDGAACQFDKNLRDAVKRGISIASLGMTPEFVIGAGIHEQAMITPVKGNDDDMFTAFRESAKQPEEAEVNPEEMYTHVYTITYPTVMEPFGSEAERGAAVHEETGAQAYLTWEIEGPYHLAEVSSFTVRSSMGGYGGGVWGAIASGIANATLNKQYRDMYGTTMSLYASCRCTLHDVNGREILAYSLKTPVEFKIMQQGLFYKTINEDRLADSLIAALKKAAGGRPVPVAPVGAKTVRVGKVTLSYAAGERTYPAETEITRKALETALLDGFAASGKLRAADGDTSDFIVEADVTDCTVRMESEGDSKGAPDSIKTKFNAAVNATVRLVDAKTKAVAATYQGKASGRSESEAFGKLVKKFFKEANKAVK